jgi:hypothetical protein
MLKRERGMKVVSERWPRGKGAIAMKAKPPKYRQIAGVLSRKASLGDFKEGRDDY